MMQSLTVLHHHGNFLFKNYLHILNSGVFVIISNVFLDDAITHSIASSCEFSTINHHVLLSEFFFLRAII